MVDKTFWKETIPFKKLKIQLCCPLHRNMFDPRAHQFYDENNAKLWEKATWSQPVNTIIKPNGNTIW